MDIKLIAAILAKMDINQLRAMARETSVSVSTLNRIRYGHLTDPRVSLVARLVEYLSKK